MCDNCKDCLKNPCKSCEDRPIIFCKDCALYKEEDGICLRLEETDRFKTPTNGCRYGLVMDLS